MGERRIPTDQFKIGTGTDEKYEILSESKCAVVATLRIISKFQAHGLGNLIGEYLRDKVKAETVIYQQAPQIIQP